MAVSSHAVTFWMMTLQSSRWVPTCPWNGLTASSGYVRKTFKITRLGGSLIPRSWILLQNPLVSQIFKNLGVFYGSWSFIIVFTRPRHWPIFWARWSQSILPHHISLRSVLILSSHLRLGLPSGVFHSGFPTIFFNSSRWGETVHSVRLPLIGPLLPTSDDKYGVFGGMRIGRRNHSKPAPVPRSPP
jgi:hypothetical protein